MSAKHAVLGLVIERPGYGYDLARRLRERFGSAGFAPTGVYSALDQLSAEGLVRSAGRSADDSAERAAPRTVYEATTAGGEHFDRWMRSDSPLAHVRDELNMKLALSRPCDLPGLLELACVQEQECLERLEALKHGPPGKQRSGGRRGLAWEEVATLLVRDAETRQLQARVEWLQRTRAIMARAMASAPGGAVHSGSAPAGAAQRDGGGSEETRASARMEARVA